MIRDEGLEKLTALELQNANVDRGMRSVGVSVERLRNQLDQVCHINLVGYSTLNFLFKSYSFNSQNVLKHVSQFPNTNLLLSG